LVGPVRDKRTASPLLIALVGGVLFPKQNNPLYSATEKAEIGE
jgi:hypothetical protein